MTTRTSRFTEAYLAFFDGATVRVRDQEGRLGTVVTIGEADPATRTPADALVVWDAGDATLYTAQRFNARLWVVTR